MADQAADPGPRRSILVRVGVALAAVAVVWLISYVIQNPDLLHRVTGPGFAVGDCAHLGAGLHGSEMDKADCGTAGKAVFSGDPVYRVDSVEKGKNGICPGGFEHVTFSNEPEDTTYCLTLALR